MPELPEVETTLKAIKSFEKKILNSVSIHNPNLRWLVDNNINKKIAGKKIRQILRRAKYLIFDFVEFYFNKINNSVTPNIYNSYSYFLKRISNTKTFNLDEESLFIEFEEKILNG